MEKREPLCTAGGNVNWYSHYGRQYRDSSKIKNKITIGSVQSLSRVRLCDSGLHFLLQGIFPTQGLNLCLLHWKTDSLPLNHLGNPVLPIIKYLLAISTQSIPPCENIETLSRCSLCEIKDRVKIENRERACTIKMHVNHKLQVCDSLCYHSSFLHLL